MHQDDKILYQLLTKEIAATMKRSFPGVSIDISSWKGETITDFQEELRLKAGGKLSEKWFYTHMKTGSGTLPRIDALNLLCRYAGYSNWDDFRYKNSDVEQVIPDLKKTNRIFLTVPLLILVIMLLLLVVYRLFSTRNYIVSFIDADTGDRVRNTLIQAELLLPGESPRTYISDSTGVLTIRTDLSRLQLAISAPSYYSDTIVRIVKKFNLNEQIRLRADPYALMIRYLSESDVKGWIARRGQLDSLLSDNAIICRLPDRDGSGAAELYNKDEFIDKLTMPSSGLKNIDIVSTKYQDGRIMILKFRKRPEAK